jgi:hypothetical protein
MATSPKNKIVKLYGMKFEWWRICQGGLIYTVLFVLSALDAVNGWRPGILLLLVFCFIAITIYCYRYRKRVRNRKHLLAVAVLKTVCLPATTINS